jgi:repressor LexA
MSLAKRLKELRKVKKISQRELAKILKVSSGAVGMYETGKREPDFKPSHHL